MTEHRVHLLWLTDRGLQLWVEQVPGHAVVVDPSALGEGDLPEPLLDLVGSRVLRRREGLKVVTPKGKLKTLPLYTQSWIPEQSLGVLARLSHYVDDAGVVGPRGKGPAGTTGSADSGVTPGLSPEVVWAVHLYRFLCEIVAAGRVMVRLQFSDSQWFPVWCISTSGRHNRILREFRDTAPAVLTVNGGDDVVTRMADELVHWMCVSLLQDRLPRAGVEPGNHFVSALVSGQADSRLTPVVADGLAEWRRSAREATTRTVLVLQEPLTGETDGGTTGADTAEPSVGETVPAERATADRRAGLPDPDSRCWRLEVRLSVDDAPAERLPATSVDEPTRRALRRALDAAYRAWPGLRDAGTAVEGWMRTGVWFPDPDVLTGDRDEDRALAFALTTADVEELLTEGVPALAASGTEVLVPRGWSTVRPAVRVRVTPVGTGPSEGRMGMDQVLSFDWSISVDGEELSQAQKNELLTTAGSTVRIRGRFVRLDRAALSRARNYFRSMTDAEDSTGTRTTTAEKSGPGADRSEQEQWENSRTTLTVRELVAAQMRAGDQPWDDDPDFTLEAQDWIGRIFGGSTHGEGKEGKESTGLAGTAFSPPERVTVPSTVTVPLRDHQQRGLNWLVWMYRHRLGAVLADDMGLGKTLQVLSLLAWESVNGEKTGPTLVVAPTSVLDTWRGEVERHVPSLKVLVDHGSAKVAEKDFPEAAGSADIVLTSYGTVARNAGRYAGVHWGRVVADEAQNIKNPGTAQSRAVRSLEADHRLALSGTPVENRLSELHTLMDFCNPGLLGSAKAFHNAIGSQIERDRNPRDVERLHRLVDPFILRREKTDESLGLGLPGKHEYTDLVPLTAEQAALYQAYTQDIRERLQSSSTERRSGLVLAALTHFKEICNHPAHFSGDGSGVKRDGVHRSGKVERLWQIVGDALAGHRRVLVFTQFPSFGRMLAPEMEKDFGIEVPVLHGGLSRKARTTLVDRFQESDGPEVMILSTRAGGTGITLTRASVVVHIDRWWNPAVEDQATDRAYRIGQGQEVSVHKLIATGTLDERINDILGAKRDLAGDVVSAGESWLTRMDNDALQDLWRLENSTSDRRFGTGGPDGEEELQKAAELAELQKAEFREDLARRYPVKNVSDNEGDSDDGQQ
ncbi:MULTISPECIES: DEAD/DEAH box helicase [Corynebacterium]|uniref:DEAD/DEAH box helicase n=1 Tax=Corynebacterium TaxID=1716 RepID=UPI000D7C7D87|nr:MULTISPECIES: DEAD/DEAH box helicase [Corynebacterium]